MQNRLRALQERLIEEEADCAVVGPTTNMLYLLGGAPHPDERLCLLLVTPNAVQIIAPQLNADMIETQCMGGKIIFILKLLIMKLVKSWERMNGENWLSLQCVKKLCRS